MSHDLVSLGIANQNLTPNNPALDARPLFQAALQYVQSHSVQTLTLDTGNYYLLTPEQSNAVLVFPELSNLVVDLAESTFYFNTPLLNNGFLLYFCTNVTFTNFQTDYLIPPYTHVRISSVDTVNRVIHYQNLPGWPDPSTFNNLVDPFGGTVQYWAALFRNGQVIPGTSRTALVPPFSNSALVLEQDYTPWTQAATLSTLQAGDTVVVAARAGGPPVEIWEGDSITLSNAKIYGSNGFAVQLYETSNTVVDNVSVMPRPGTGLIGSNADGIHFSSTYQNNHIRNSYVSRTEDDALIMDSQMQATVIAVNGTQQLTVTRSGFDRFPNGTAVNFLDPVSTQEIAGATIVSQTPPDSQSPGPGEQVVLNFDRPLPALTAGQYMVYGSAALRGSGGTFEDNVVEDTIGGRGIWINGVMDVTAQRNVIRRTSEGGLSISQDTAADPAPPVHNITVTDNVVEESAAIYGEGTGVQESLGAVQVVSTNNQSYGFASAASNSAVTIQNNYIVNSGRSGIWIGELNGGTLQNNLVIGSSQNPTLGGIYGIPPPFQNLVMQDALLPVVVHYSSGVTETGDTTISAPITASAPATLTPPGANWSAKGGAGSFTVQTAITGFDWRAVSDSPWLTVSSGSGPGSGAVGYTVAANTSGVARTGNIVIAGVSFSITQTAPLPQSAVGIYRSSNGLWLENSTFNNMFTSADTVTLFAGSGLTPQAGDLPVAGDWTGTGTSKIGLYRPSTGTWFLDKNGNGVFDGPAVDLEYQYGGIPGDLPVVGDWNGSGTSKIGIFRAGFLWLLDANGNGMFDSGDQTFAFGGATGCTGPLPGFYNSEPAGSCDIPVVGDWNHSGTTKAGIVRAAPGTAQPFLWILDTTGAQAFGSSSTVFAFGGIPGDVPVVGDWNNSGATQIGVFRDGFLWVEDTTATMPTPPAATDSLAAFAYGGVAGDMPVVGHW